MCIEVWMQGWIKRWDTVSVFIVSTSQLPGSFMGLKPMNRWHMKNLKGDARWKRLGEGWVEWRTWPGRATRIICNQVTTAGSEQTSYLRVISEFIKNQYFCTNIIKINCLKQWLDYFIITLLYRLPSTRRTFTLQVTRYNINNGGREPRKIGERKWSSGVLGVCPCVNKGETLWDRLSV